jgi:putative aminopeptidase FrvX
LQVELRFLKLSLRTGVPMKIVHRSFIAAALLISLAQAAAGQSKVEIAKLTAIPAVSGYEQALADEIRQSFKEFSPKTDNVGNVYVTLGNGAPHRLIVTPMDEPGYVVSEITPDGYLRVQRLPQAAPNAVFDLLHAAQPVWVMTRKGKKVSGVFAGLSVHLQPARQNAPKVAHPDEMYVDIGASSASEVRAAGVDVLDPIALNVETREIGRTEWNPTGNGGRFGIVALLNLLNRARPAKLNGTLVVAFATQQWTGERGLDRLLNEINPDEMIYVGRALPARGASDSASLSSSAPGTGVLLSVNDLTAELAPFHAELKALAVSRKLSLKTIAAALPRIAGYAKGSSFPQRFAHLSVPDLWPVTPAETVDLADVRSLTDFLMVYATGSDDDDFIDHVDPRTPQQTQQSTIKQLVEAYGASGHESPVRQKVQALLPKWAKTQVDEAGNLVLNLGDAKPDSKTPRIVFMAHMDEIGYEIHSVEPDGRLSVDVLGGGYTEFFLGHPVLVHKSDGKRIGGVLELPNGWDKPGFEWRHGPRGLDEPAHVYLGTHSAEETQKLGVKVGDWLTIPKEYRPLLGTRANGRSFDDRVGCAALVEAVRALGPNLPGRDITFVWSTEEEVGLKGAAAYAERSAKEGKTPDFVFAIDTFVSSDSPLESKRFADAEIGKGFVIRAVDNSNITPREYVDRVVKLAHENKIPVQYGITGGGNDGAVFTRYGSVDIPLSWPLRYSHSPGEVIDTRDLDALAKIVAVLAKNW